MKAESIQKSDLIRVEGKIIQAQKDSRQSGGLEDSESDDDSVEGD